MVGSANSCTYIVFSKLETLTTIFLNFFLFENSAELYVTVRGRSPFACHLQAGREAYNSHSSTCGWRDASNGPFGVWCGLELQRADLLRPEQRRWCLPNKRTFSTRSQNDAFLIYATFDIVAYFLRLEQPPRSPSRTKSPRPFSFRLH